MFDILNPPFPKKKIQLNLIKLTYLKDRYNTNFIRVRDYLRMSSVYANSEHLLVKLLSSISISKQQSHRDYYDDLDDSQFYYASVHNITSDRLKKKSVINGTFFGGKRSIETYVLDNSDFDIKSNWRDWQPVRLINSDIIDFNLSYPDGNNLDDTVSCSSIISINIKMLVLQYRLYEESDLDLLFGDVKRNMANFLIRYPLANMLPSIVDVSFYNSFKEELQIGYPVRFKKRNMSVALTNMEFNFKGFITETINTLSSNPKLNWNDIINLIPTIYAPDILHMSYFGRQIYSNQNLWIFAAIGYDFYTTAMCLCNNDNLNLGIYTDIVKNTRTIVNGRYLEQGCPLLASMTTINKDIVIDHIIKHRNLDKTTLAVENVQLTTTPPLIKGVLRNLVLKLNSRT